MQTNEALLQPGNGPLSDSVNSQSGSVQCKWQRGWIINDDLTIVISEHPNSSVCCSTDINISIDPEIYSPS